LAALMQESRRLAEVFAGKSREYQAAPGWNPEGLAASLQAVLPEATEHTDEPV